MAIANSWTSESVTARTIAGHRFEVLDSWRGICALLVVAFHFPLAGPISQSALVRGAFLFVDFFFVLSGFVFAYAYGKRLMKGEGLSKFILTRIGRLVPLHLFMLAVLVSLEVLRWSIPALGNGQPIFSGRNTLDTLLPNIFMLHGLNVLDELTWNTPSWSISVELFAYILFGCILVMAKHRALAFAALTFLACFAFLRQSPTFIDVTYDFGLIRCLYGFSAGMLVHRFFQIAPLGDASGKRSALLWTSAELLVVFSTVVFVAKDANTIYSLFAPFIFGLAVLVFAQQKGMISTLLMARPFVYLGAISYSLYMTHLMVQGCIYALARFGHAHFGWAELTKLETVGAGDFVFSATENLALVAMMIAATILVSSLTYRYIEKPSREWFRQLAGRWG
jgi:peptidoglycan/LPS O-acetylase OafA/YrhL